MRAKDAIMQLRKSQRGGPRLKFVMVVGQNNIVEVPEYLRFAALVDCVEFIPQQPFKVAINDGVQPYSQQFLDKVEETIALLLKAKAAGASIENSERHINAFAASFRGQPNSVRCFAAYNSLAVDCFGRIFPCVPWVNWNLPAGSIFPGGLKDFWYSREYQKVRPKINNCRECYLNCQAELNYLF
jgi:MoaA/NifB/PqqE/SkfB family radical SAM enzyme